MTRTHHGAFRLAAISAALMLAGSPVLGQDAAQPPAHVQLQKTIGRAKPDIVPSLFVLNSDGATLANAS